jgi:acetyl esterase/lipase
MTCTNTHKVRQLSDTSQEEITDPLEVLSRPAPPPDLTLRYGPGGEQVADLWLPQPRSGPAPLVLFLHGGFWRAEFDRTHARPLANALAAAGYAVCTPEFRRTGQEGGGWPGTFDDVAAAVDALPALADVAAGPGRLAPTRLVLAGHSAGGHLALWTAGRHRIPPASRWHAPERPYLGVVALAPVSDLAACHAGKLGRGAADALIGGSPRRYPDRYALADPARLTPLGTTVRIVHGSADDRVPCAMSRNYAAHATSLGDQVVLDELPGYGHFELIDPLSAAWPAVLAAFHAIAS